MELIYCAGGNSLLQHIALDEGWFLGQRSDAALSKLPQIFIDIDYKNPDFQRHLEVVAYFRPKYATVPDLSDKETDREDIKRAMRQYEQLARYCEIPLIVPKLSEQLALLPSDVAIGYSVPSSYGSAQFLPWELAGRRVHLLGGSPKKQMELYRYLTCYATITSVDGNYAQRMATRYAEYWEQGRWHDHPDIAGKKKDLYYDCWRRSCRNLRQAWDRLACNAFSVV